MYISFPQNNRYKYGPTYLSFNHHTKIEWRDYKPQSPSLPYVIVSRSFQCPNIFLKTPIKCFRGWQSYKNFNKALFFTSSYAFRMQAWFNGARDVSVRCVQDFVLSFRRPELQNAGLQLAARRGTSLQTCSPDKLLGQASVTQSVIADVFHCRQ